MIYQSNLTDGWTPAGETWTSLGGTAITSTLTMTTKYTVGDRLKFTQGGTTMYQAVRAVSGTLVYPTGGSTYVLGTTEITNPYYSHTESPIGYPSYFTYTPNYDAFAPMTYTSVATEQAFFWVTGGICNYIVSANGTTGGTASTGIQFSLPINVGTIMAANRIMGYGWGYDTTEISVALEKVSASVIRVVKIGGVWGLGATRIISVGGSYPI